jgi:hypothetical protein
MNSAATAASPGLWPPIVGGGANACVLHYVENDAPLRDGDLVLVDAGCELHGYASDITRTFPVNGRFSPAQQPSTSWCSPRSRPPSPRGEAGQALERPARGGGEGADPRAGGAGPLEGTHDDVPQLIKDEKYKPFYMHRTGHWLGMDVHDVGDYKQDGKWRALEPGMVLTVEPGLYVAPDAEGRRSIAASASASRTTCWSPRRARGAEPRRAEGHRRHRATWTTRLLVAADGVDSPVREAPRAPRRALALRPHGRGDQCHAGTAAPQRAYERFTDTGPLALLPMSGTAAPSSGPCVTTRSTRCPAGLDDAAVLDALQRRFGYRLGAFQRAGAACLPAAADARARVGARSRRGDRQRRAHPPPDRRAGLQPRHPRRGRAGRRDRRCAAGPRHRSPRDCSMPTSAGGRANRHLVALATDGLARLFSNPLGILRLGRNLGLTAMELVPGLKHPLARAAMGMAGRQPRLARGVRLG